MPSPVVVEREVGGSGVGVGGLAVEGQGLAVVDSGCGIPEADQSRLGEPFFTTKPVGSGTGLGLTVCRDLLRMNDGRLQIESEPGQGTTATIVLAGEESP